MEIDGITSRSSRGHPGDGVSDGRSPRRPYSRNQAGRLAFLLVRQAETHGWHGATKDNVGSGRSEARSETTLPPCRIRRIAEHEVRNDLPHLSSGPGTTRCDSTSPMGMSLRRTSSQHSSLTTTHNTAWAPHHECPSSFSSRNRSESSITSSHQMGE